LNISVGKLVLTATIDHSQHEVYPHLVTPLSVRCFWNFFTRSWNIDEIIVPPYQLQTEFGPQEKYVEIEDPSPSILTNNNREEDGNNETDVSKIVKNAWDFESFEMVAFAPESHRYYHSVPNERLTKNFMDVMMNEISVLKSKGSIPEGIWIRCYENRLVKIVDFLNINQD
jgi:hypothetical protein